jgi:hypothetical protein
VVIPHTSRLPRAIAIVLALAAFAIGIGFGTRTAGGSDGYAYVSHADLWIE